MASQFSTNREIQCFAHGDAVHELIHNGGWRGWISSFLLPLQLCSARFTLEVLAVVAGFLSACGFGVWGCSEEPPVSHRIVDHCPESMHVLLELVTAMDLCPPTVAVVNHKLR
jgi:hypothetical protein